MKASALALREHPRVNGSYRDGQVLLYPRVNVAIAVAAGDAILTPVIYEAETTPLGEIARTNRVVGSVRSGTITPAQLDGGTFTVSNLGMYGVDEFVAVITPPQAAILAVGSVRTKPVVDETGGVAVKAVMRLTLSCDHRVLSGEQAALFLGAVRDRLEQPDPLLEARSAADD